MMKNGVFLIVIALVVAELFKILIYANLRNCDIPRMTRNDVKSQNIEYQENRGLKFLPKMTNALLVAPKSDRLPLAWAVLYP